MRFVLIHGAATGGQCWVKFVRELEDMGHEAVAPDLPGSGQRWQEQATLEAYRDAVLNVLEDGDVLVGHSMAGYIIRMVADVAPKKIAHLMYIAAAVPSEGLSILDATSLSDLGMEKYIDIFDTPNGPAFRLKTVEDAIELFFTDFSPEDAQWMFDSSTAQQLAPLSPPISVPRFWTCDIPRSYLLCTRDNSGVIPFAAAQLERLGLKSAYLIDTAHYPFISQPRKTAEILLSAVLAGQ